MKRLVIILFCLLIMIPAFGQRTIRLMQAGDEFFQNEEYTKAVEAYDKILQRDRSDEVRKEISFKMGESYRKLLNYSEAWKWYTVALNVGYQDPVIFLHLSEMGLGLEDFDNAIYYATKYLKEHPSDPLGEKILESAHFSRDNYFLESLIEVTNEKGINSKGQEWGIGFFENIALFHQDPERRAKQYDIDIHLKYNNVIFWALRSERLKERIVFASTKDESGRLDTRTGTGYSSIYQATYSRRHDKWDTPSLLQGEINSDHYEGFLSYDKKNLTAYYMNCGGYQGTRNTCDIYTVDYDPANDRWSTPSIFPVNSDEYNVGYPSISEDGETLYFSSDMPGGYGGYDLYVIRRDPESGMWSEPNNLGPAINTELNDAYPHIAGNILYFSSFGRPGFGGFDIFYSEIDNDGNYSDPENMGTPINSSADDFSFIINEEYTMGYFTSNRPGGSGEDDIYSFRINQETFMLKGKVTDSRTAQPISEIELLIYGDDGKVHRFTTDSLGFYEGELNSEVNYQIEANNSDYYPYHESFSVKEKLIASRFLVIKDFQKDLQMLPVAPLLLEDEISTESSSGRTDSNYSIPALEEEELLADSTFGIRPEIRGHRGGLPVILFDFGHDNLDKSAKLQVDSVIDYLKNNPEVGLLIHGHTDQVSSYLFNFYLSQRRAQTIISYLEKEGIDADRLFGIGHGKMQLAIENAVTDEDHHLNRRVDFEVLPLEKLKSYISLAPRHSFRYLNSLDKQAHYSEGIEFMVQFAATKNPIHPRYYRDIMKAIPDLDIIYYYDIDRYHRYSLGSFRDLESSLKVHRQLRDLGFHTYIVAFKDGKRFNVAEANRIIENR